MNITFLFKDSRRARLLNKITHPSDFFYGFTELSEKHQSVNLMEETELLGYCKQTFCKKISDKISHYIVINLYNFFKLITNKRKINAKSGALIATTASLGVLLSVMGSFNLLPKKTKVYCYIMGLDDKPIHFIKKCLYVFIFRKSILLTLSKNECLYLKNIFKNSLDIRHIGFGVDYPYWSVVQSFPQKKPYILSIGNDPRRDYDTLLDAWKAEYPQLTLITKRAIKKQLSNVDHKYGDWHAHAISDDELRQLYHNALFVIVPVKQTWQPSGQSVCLQAMACGKAVIMANINGLWEPDLMVHGETCLLYDPGDSQSLQACIQTLLDDQDLLNKIAFKAQAIIKSNLNMQNIANRLYQTIAADQ